MVIERPEEHEPRFASALDRRSPIPKAVAASGLPKAAPPAALPPMRAPMPTISIDVDVEWDREAQEVPAASLARASSAGYDGVRWKRVPPDPGSRVRRWLSEDV